MPRVGKELRKCKKHGLTEFLIYANNRKYCVACSSERKKKANKDKRTRAYEYLGNKCVICGYNSCFDALDFHHINPNEKEGNIPIWSSWEKIKKELDKCVLLCATCHRETHAGLHPEYLIEG